MHRTFLLLTMALALVVSVAWCQGNLGGLTGRIADSTGAGVPAVALKITNIDTAAEVRISSSSDGSLSCAEPATGTLPRGRQQGRLQDHCPGTNHREHRNGFNRRFHAGGRSDK